MSRVCIRIRSRFIRGSRFISSVIRQSGTTEFQGWLSRKKGKRKKSETTAQDILALLLLLPFAFFLLTYASLHYSPRRDHHPDVIHCRLPDLGFDPPGPGKLLQRCEEA